MKHHTEDYKETAVKYYLENKEDMRNTCKIFKCNFQSLARWIKTYKNKGNINSKYKNYLVIMDNAVIHKSKLIREKIEYDNNYLLYSVPYHPETNSIEEFFSQLKHYIKKESPNTYDDIYNVITNILEKKITKEHLTNYLKHSYKIYKS